MLMDNQPAAVIGATPYMGKSTDYLLSGKLVLKAAAGYRHIRTGEANSHRIHFEVTHLHFSGPGAAEQIWQSL
jgi:hypothetical protein